MEEILFLVLWKTIRFSTFSSFDPRQASRYSLRIKAGVPDEYVGMFAGFAEAIKQGEFSAEITDLENLLGRKPTTAKAFLKDVYASK